MGEVVHLYEPQKIKIEKIVVTAKRQCFNCHWVNNSKVFYFPQRFKSCGKKDMGRKVTVRIFQLSFLPVTFQWAQALRSLQGKSLLGADHCETLQGCVALPAFSGFMVMSLKALEIFRLCRTPWLTNTHIPVDFWGRHFHESYIYTSSRCKKVGAKPG